MGTVFKPIDTNLTMGCHEIEVYSIICYYSVIVNILKNPS